MLTLHKLLAHPNNHFILDKDQQKDQHYIQSELMLVQKYSNYKVQTIKTVLKFECYVIITRDNVYEIIDYIKSDNKEFRVDVKDYEYYKNKKEETHTTIWRHPNFKHFLLCQVI